MCPAPCSWTFRAFLLPFVSIVTLGLCLCTFPYVLTWDTVSEVALLGVWLRPASKLLLHISRFPSRALLSSVHYGDSCPATIWLAPSGVLSSSSPAWIAHIFSFSNDPILILFPSSLLQKFSLFSSKKFSFFIYSFCLPFCLKDGIVLFSEYYSSKKDFISETKTETSLKHTDRKKPDRWENVPCDSISVDSVAGTTCRQ